MIYPEDVICEELCWEYSISRNRATLLINAYKAAGKYAELCQLIRIRKGVPIKEVIYGCVS